MFMRERSESLEIGFVFVRSIKAGHYSAEYIWMYLSLYQTTKFQTGPNWKHLQTTK